MTSRRSPRGLPGLAWAVGLLGLLVGLLGRAEDRASRPARADFDPAEPVGFAAVVEPTLTLLGCNAGSCHGKAGGQRGFALSLFGSDPQADFRALAARVDPADPAASKLILKATGAVPHGGGRKLAAGSTEHGDLLRWIAELGPSCALRAEPSLLRLDVDPPTQVIPRRGAGRVRVRAVRTDGSVVDVTRLARFEADLAPVATVDAGGQVRAGDLVGAATVLIRYGRDLATARVVVPSGEHPAIRESAAASTSWGWRRPPRPRTPSSPAGRAST